jgi:hypothetical protein
MKRMRLAISVFVLLSLLLTVAAYAQYSDPWYTAYQIVNMGDQMTDITVRYYDGAGSEQVSARKNFTDVPANGTVLVLQFSDDPDLDPGKYSAVIEAGQPIAAIANQQLNPAGSTSYNPIPPFATYSGEKQGARQITLPAVMHNWYDYYTEIYIMNVGTGNATDVDITYVPSQMDIGAGLEPTGASGQTDLNNSIPQFASLHKSQLNMTNLGAPSGTFKDRFFGSAIITSDQDIIAVVNQHNAKAYKLMTYNGFAGGSDVINAPSYMRNYYGYYTTLLIANPDDTDSANVTIEYIPDTSEPYYNEAEPGSSVGTVSVDHVIPPQVALMRHDGPTASDGQSDLDDHDQTGHAFVKFFGSVKVTSDIDVMVQVNVEANSPGDGQAGSYNGIPTIEASQNLVAPVILADFYGYYTNLVVQNTTSSPGSCDVTYTSDAVLSLVKNHSETYTHALPADGSFSVYEGRKGGAERGDINSDATWGPSGGRRFIGAATIDCTVNAVAFVNEESDVLNADSMYTMNTFRK